MKKLLNKTLNFAVVMTTAALVGIYAYETVQAFKGLEEALKALNEEDEGKDENEDDEQGAKIVDLN